MTKQFKKLLGIGLFIILAAIIMGIDQRRLIDGRSMISIIVGAIILTLSQMNRKTSIKQIVSFARWNAFFSGILMTLLLFLASIKDPEYQGGNYLNVLIPLVYGSVFYLIIDWFLDQRPKILEKNQLEDKPEVSIQQAAEILAAKGFSPREVHVALKIIENCTNKSIASQLFISEATVKKHIQNMFRKCGAEDRAAFIELYKSWINQ